jgi:protein-S-isoprenylcysteine O-methyltransferase Ste14
MLKNEMPRRGQWLFVRRSFVPLLLLPVIALVLAEDRVGEFLSRYVSFEFTGRHAAQPKQWEYVWDGTCLAISMIGVVVRAIAVGYAAENTSGRNTREGQRADELNTTGLYSLVRNPLYLGNLVITLGVLFTVRSWELVAIFILAFFLYYERIIFAEEAFLEGKFGDAYREWAAATPCLLPRIFPCRGAPLPPHPPAGTAEPKWRYGVVRWVRPPRRFSWRRAVRSEYQSVFGIVVAILAIKLGRDFLEGRPFEIDPVRGIAFVAAAALYVVVRTIKKRTRLLGQ